MPSAETNQVHQAILLPFSIHNIPFSSLILPCTLYAYFIHFPRIEPLAFASEILKSNNQDVTVVVSAKNVLMRIDDIIRKTVAYLIETFLGIKMAS
jgi:hypothetical protein